MRLTRIVVAGASVAILAGCGQATVPSSHPAAPAPLPPPRPVSAQVARATAGSDAAFGGALYGRLPRAGNAVISPLSVGTALQMALAGARGRTASQMRHALHLAPTQPLASVIPNAGKAELHISNNLWLRPDTDVLASYSRSLGDTFGARPRTVDFSTDRARRTINATVSAETKGKISELFPRGSLDPSTILALTNAVYLKAAWAYPFHSSSQAPFHRANRSTVTADMMPLTGALGYLKRPGYQAVQLPYAGSKLAMTVLLPTGSLAPLEKRLATGGLTDLLTGIRPQALHLDMPKFTFHTNVELNKPLQDLGMRDAFDSTANFDGMVPKGGLFISTVEHQAYIKVDEHGTEAAAATGVGVGAGAAAPPSTSVTLDRPFLFAITDTTTGAPLFLGRVADPTD